MRDRFRRGRKAVSLAALATTLSVTACSTGSAPREPTIDATVTGSPDASATDPQPVPAVAGMVAQEIAVGDGPGDFPTVAFGSLWVPNIADGTISRIDLQTGQVVSTVPIGRSDEPPDRSNVSPFSVAAGGGSVWATRDLDDRYAVVRVDPGTSRVVESFRVDATPYALAWGAGAVWMTSRDDGAVVRIDPSTGEARVADVERATGIVVDGSAVWVGTGWGELHRLDPATGRAMARTMVGADLEVLAAGGGSLWAADGGAAAVVRIEPATGRAMAEVELPGPTWTLAATHADVWAGASSTLYRIDQASGEVVGEVALPGSVNGIAVGAGSIWAASVERDTVYRITPVS